MTARRVFMSVSAESPHESASKTSDVRRLEEEEQTLRSEYFGRPLEEVDPFVQEDSFCAIGKKYGQYYIYRFSASKSLCMFSPMNPVRRAAVRVYTNVWFDIAIISVIVSNCCTLAFTTNFEIGRTEVTYKDQDVEQAVDHMEVGFLLFYFLELLVKAISKGFVMNRWAYLRNKWNILDMSVLIFATVHEFMEMLSKYTEYTTEFGTTMEVTRPIAVLRVIKIVHMLPGLKTMINSLLGSFVQLVEVMVLAMFSLSMFALVALQIFLGKFRNRCVLNSGSPTNPDSPLFHTQWRAWALNISNHQARAYRYPYQEAEPCGNFSFSRHCKEGYTCIPDVGDNFDQGWIGFDSFGMSLVTTMQLLTLDFWERVYGLILSTINPWTLIFILSVVFFGAYYLINLMLAVVAQSYENEARKAEEEQDPSKRQLKLYRKKSEFNVLSIRGMALKIMTELNQLSPAERYQAALAKQAEDGPKGTKASLGNAIMMLLGRRPNPDDMVVTLRTARPTRFYESSNTSVSATATQIDIGDPPDQAVAQLASGANSHVVKQDVNRRIITRLRKIVESAEFEMFITFAIILNTLVQASEHHGEPRWLTTFVKQSYYVFVSIFALEAFLKIVALGREYFRSAWNLFDLITVVVSILDLSTPEKYNLTVLRATRILRVFKLAQSWVTMRMLLNIIFSTFGALVNLIALLLIVLYIFAVFGLQSLGKYYLRSAFEDPYYDSEPEIPRWNFQNMFFAFLMTFRVLCGEWIEPMVECFRATRLREFQSKEEDYLCFVFFIPGLVFCNFLVLNLFLALLLDSFDTDRLKKAQEDGTKKADNLKKVVGMIFSKEEGEMEEQPPERAFEDKASSFSSIAVSESSDALQRFRAAVNRVIIMNRKLVAIRAIERHELKLRMRARSAQMSVFSHAMVLQQAPTVFREDFGEEAELCFPAKCWYGNCCCMKCMRKSTPKWCVSLRASILQIVSHQLFEWLILGLIFAASITLCFDDIHMKPGSKRKYYVDMINFVLTSLFVLEFFMKVIAYGIWVYFTSFWTVLDFIIITLSVISISPLPTQQHRGFDALKVFRTLRALRPLRAISRWQGMKIVVNAIMYAIPSIINVLLVCLMFWLVFAIMGVQLFKGKFTYCVNSEGDLLSYQIIQTKTQCCALAESKNYSWVPQYPNYDNVFMSYLTLFQVATFEGWMEAMRFSVDSHEVIHDPSLEEDPASQPERDNELVYYVFYVVFIVLGSFFTLNLFIGVIIDNFNRLKKQYEGNLVLALLTADQVNYYLAMKKLGRKKPNRVIERPRHPILCLFYEVAMSKRLEVAAIVVVLLNMMCMAMQHQFNRQSTDDVIDVLNLWFFSLYVLEAAIKLIGLRQYYFTSWWNWFDLMLVITAMVEAILQESKYETVLGIPPSTLRVIRVLRIGRILRLVKAAKGIRKLFFTLIVSLPALFNIGALLFLLTFIYAIMGMAMFQRAALNSTYDTMFNFQTFYQSMLILVRVMTAAGWNDVLDALTNVEPECGSYRKIKCTHNAESDECVQFGAAVAYFVTYLILSYILVLNMFIAVILENYTEATREEEIGIMDDDIEMFYSVWARYDPQATQFIQLEQLSSFLDSLEPPMQVAKPNMLAIVSFNLPIARGGKVHCLDVIYALTENIVGEADDSEQMKKLQEQIEQEFAKQFPTRQQVEIVSSTRLWKLQYNAAIVIQRAWREHNSKQHPDKLETNKKIGSKLGIANQHKQVMSVVHKLNAKPRGIYSRSARGAVQSPTKSPSQKR